MDNKRSERRGIKMNHSKECQSCGSENLHLVEYCPTVLRNENWILPKKFCNDCGQIQGIWKINLRVKTK